MIQKLLRLFGFKKVTKPKPKFKQHIVFCSLREQVYRRIEDYDKLIDMQYKYIDMVDKYHVVEYGKVNQDEEFNKRKAEYYFMKNIDELTDKKILIYELIMPLSENCN